MKNDVFPDFYLLKIRLADLEPAVFRLVVVPARVRLDFLHMIIQVVMGWNDVHQFAFNIDGRWFSYTPESPEDGETAHDHKLDEVVAAHGRQFTYIYDLGDNWLHEITVLDTDYPHPLSAVPVVCLDGSGPCPIEDVGGVPGYTQFREAMDDRRHPEHRALKEWLNDHPNYGPRYDWRNFKLKPVNDFLRYMFDAMK